jgi:hypothetical protein
VFNKINLLVLVDEVLVSVFERVIANGMTIDIINNTATANPPRTEERQGQLMNNDHAPLLLLEMIAILYSKHIRLLTEDQNHFWNHGLQELKLEMDGM